MDKNQSIVLMRPPPEEEPEVLEEQEAGPEPVRARDWLFRYVPALGSLRNYSWKVFRLDLIAGLTVAAVAVPQAMAYATIAGLDPKYGLYTAIVMTAVGALLDSSRQLINGPTNAISIALLSALTMVPDENKIAYAILLAFLMGVIQTGITLMRLGDLTRYISHSVIVGFTLGAALLLVMDQFKNLLGVPNPTPADRVARIALEPHAEGVLLPVDTSSEGHGLGTVSARGGALQVTVLLPPEKVRANQVLTRTLSDLFHLDETQVEALPRRHNQGRLFLLRGLTVAQVQEKMQAFHWEVEEHFIWRFAATVRRIGEFHPWTLLIGLGTIGFILMFRWIHVRWGVRLPEFLLVTALMGLAVWFFSLDTRGVRVVGEIPRELPAFKSPHITWTRSRELMGSALAIGILGLLEAIAMAKAIAARTGQKLDINQQCLSEGVANLVGSYFQCFPGSGSLTRSNINVQAGGMTQWSGVIAAAAVALTVLALAPLAYYIPRAALAGILMVSAWRLVDRKQLLYHLRTTRFDAGIVIATALSAIVISVEFCILIGVFLSFVMFVPRAARLHMAELILTPERVIRERQPKEPACSKILIFNVEGELFFGAAADLEKHLERITQRAQEGVRVVVLRLKRVRNPDAVCLEIFERFLAQMEERRISLLLCGVRPDLFRVLHTSGLGQRLGRHQIFQEKPDAYSSTLDAVRTAYELLNMDFCINCPRRGEMGKEVLYYMI